MDLHNNRRIGDCHPILLLLSALIFIYKIIHIYILTSEVLRRLLIGIGGLSFFPGSVPDHQYSIIYDLFTCYFWCKIIYNHFCFLVAIVIVSFKLEVTFSKFFLSLLGH